MRASPIRRMSSVDPDQRVISGLTCTQEIRKFYEFHIFCVFKVLQCRDPTRFSDEFYTLLFFLEHTTGLEAGNQRSNNNCDCS